MRSRCEPCIFRSYTRLCMLWSWQWWGWNLHGRRWKLLNRVTMYHYVGSSCWSYIFKEYDIIVDSPAGEPGSSFCGSADEEDWCGSLSFDASCWNESRLWVPTYCLDEDEHRSLIDRGTEYSLAKICWSFVCLLVQEDMLDGEDASDMEDFSEEAVQGWNCKVWSKKHTFSHDSQIPILLLVCVGIFQNLVWKRELVDLPFQLVTRGLVRSMG